MKFKLSKIIEDSVVDGPGLRMAIFAQGCLRGCPGCHNPHTQPLDGGQEAETAEVLTRLEKNPLLEGVTLTGGEPFLQPGAMLEIAKGAHAMGRSVFCYTGETFEAILAKGGEGLEFLKQIDVLVDGPFILEERSLLLKFAGSRNQRAIDVPKSLETGEIHLKWAVNRM